MELLSFKEFITEAAQDAPGSATVFEKYIVDAWNTLLENPGADDKFTSEEFQDDKHQSFAPTAFKIARLAMKRSGSKSRMLHSGADVVGITKEYSSLGGTDKTPKADIRTADNTLRLSLKENVSSQLLSGGKTDALPVFKIAERRFSQSAAGVSAIEDIFKNILDRIDPPKSAKALLDVKHMSNKDKSGKIKDGKQMGILDAAADKEFRKTLPPDVVEFLDKVTFVDKKMKEGLTSELNKLFNDNFEFKKHFTFEAASGLGKFSDKAAVANGFLVFSSKTGQSDLEMFGEDVDSKVITDLAKKLKMRLRWKHGSKVVLAGDIPKKAKLYDEGFVTYGDILEEEFTKLTDTLEEGFLDVISNVRNWLRGFVTRVLKQIRELAMKGMEYVYSFFDIQIDTVNATW